ncbi:hypothetical protein AAF712_002738 [Marasmius tenuissimus]|uniref:RRM domain-containing protein n=1 Tax=Marasmius tenuissimus TaxID=585030 RepID=A0ABR3AA50_9AGAR
MGWEPRFIKVPPPGSPQQPLLPIRRQHCYINRASAVQPPATTPSLFSSNDIRPQSHTQLLQQYETEYSIFVGDLAPETSNSDLVAVFRNPVLGLRDDREPKFIRPFLTCKNAKIMLDPVTGVSRGFGFVRFTDEADQQRALIEMHGLYCLSRPMRISPATAKVRPPGSGIPAQPGPPFQIVSREPNHVAQPVPPSGNAPGIPKPHGIDTADSYPPRYLSPIAAAIPIDGPPPISTNNNISSAGSDGLRSDTSSPVSLGGLTSTVTLFSNEGSDPVAKPFSQQMQTQHHIGIDTITTTETSTTTQTVQDHQESRKHHAQARAILGNLIGPNGEQLTITDPYNTTVFVGGLSPLINEDTLRTFFAPFGDIHYVKVPVGKNCGFVQFVRKADAENAIEKMQAFPIGGSRIRLSWGRSQYKAAQAVAQAAQAAAMRRYEVPSNHMPSALRAPTAPPSLAPIHPPLHSTPDQVSNVPSTVPSRLPPQNQQHTPTHTLLSGIDINALTQDQAIQLLRTLSADGHLGILPAATEGHDRQMEPSGHEFNSSVEPQHSFAPHPIHLSKQPQNGQMSTTPLHSHYHSPGAGLYAEEQLRAAHLASREDTIGLSPHHRHHSNHLQSQPRFGIFDHPPYNLSHSTATRDRRPSVVGAPLFSPFSPAPNHSSTPPNDALVYGSLPRRQSVLSPGLISDMNEYHAHGSRASFSGQGSCINSPTPSDSSLSPKASPTTTGSTLSESVSASSQEIGGSIVSPVLAMASGDGSGRAIVNRTVISRPGPGQQDQRLYHPQKSEPLEAICDLNGTLASLDLDSSPNPQVAGPSANVSLVSTRPLSQFGGGTWGMSVGSHYRSGIEDPATNWPPGREAIPVVTQR